MDGEGGARLPKRDQLLWRPTRSNNSEALKQGGRNLGDRSNTPARARHNQKQIAFRCTHQRRLSHEQAEGEIKGVLPKNSLGIPDFRKPEEVFSMEKAFDQHECWVQVHITTDIQHLHLSERDSKNALLQSRYSFQLASSTAREDQPHREDTIPQAFRNGNNCGRIFQA